MVRHYRCTLCGYTKETESSRGPVPLKCRECKGLPPESAKVVEAPKPISVADLHIRRPNRSSIEAQEKVIRALRMRCEYKTWDTIAKEVGYTSAQVAHFAAKQEMRRRAETLADTVDDFRALELVRLEKLAEIALDVLQTRHVLVSSGKVVMVEGPDGLELPLIDDGPTLAAIDRLVKISESARKLVGADAATKTEAQVNVNYTVEGIVESDMP